MSDLAVALGLVLVIEGLVYALAPGGIKGMLRVIEQVPETTLRAGGVAAVAVGVMIVWLVRG